MHVENDAPDPNPADVDAPDVPDVPDVDELEDRLRSIEDAMSAAQGGELDAAEDAITALEDRIVPRSD